MRVNYEIRISALEIQKIIHNKKHKTYYEETLAIEKILERLCEMESDKNAINRVQEMAVESLPPDEFEQFTTIMELLIKTRKSLHCPICHSLLEDNGACSDMGNNNCQYQA
ncbi:MAG TPA: hypothetical protein ENH85_13280 [Candidatus Scalindua sp.]|nr:hypothetical protein [Candidatus Scalindua sp.]